MYVHKITCTDVMCEFYRLIQKNPCAWLFVGCCYLKVSSLVIALACMADAKRGGEGRGGRGRKVRKRGKGKGAPAIRAGVFVFRPPFSQLIC